MHKVANGKFAAPLASGTFLAGLLALAARPAEAQIRPCVSSEGREVPCLKIDIPTVSFSQVERRTRGDETTIVVPFLAEYISGVYTYGVYAALVVAAVMAVIGGFEWLTAGDSGRISKAKDRISNAVIGLVLALGAYTLLSTVNPDILTLSGLNINVIAGEPLTVEEKEDYGDNEVPSDVSTGGEPTKAGSAGAKAYCNTIEDCRAKCANPGAWPKFVDGMLDPDLALTVPDMKGVVGNGQKASQAVIDGLERAGERAWNDDYEIVVVSGYRPFRTQMQLVCARMGNAAKEAGIGHAVAWPGSSNHGAGFAVDIRLRDAKSKKILVASGNCTGQAAGENATEEMSETLNDIMFSAGAKRYAKEIWHYEFGSDKPCRCDFSIPCPAYPPKCTGSCR